MSLSCLNDLPNYEPTVDDLNKYISNSCDYNGLKILSISLDFIGNKTLTTNIKYDIKDLSELYEKTRTSNFNKLISR
jgi:microsomal dipeptidase-like Zn-dependent dipeptidase